MTNAVTQNLLDPMWRLNNLYKIVDKHGKAVPFRLRSEQAKFLKELHGWDIILKARQLGFTTLAGVLAVDECVFNENWTCEIIAHTDKAAKKILREQVKFPYESLPDQIKNACHAVSDSADTLSLSNGSRISVSTSSRGGTLQRLHVSEFGKICARNPDRANEIVSGSFPAAEAGHITIESTAEGQSGHFFDMTQKALSRVRRDDELTSKDFKPHFFPWWKAKEYRMNPKGVLIPESNRRYFEKLEHESGIALDDEQRAWWTKQEEIQGGLMKREYPATPEEAFEQALEGAYFERQFAAAEARQSIGRFPIDPRYDVNTFWDLGRNDLNTIWFHQRINDRNRFVGYYENSGEHISHYIRKLKEFQKETGCYYDKHYWPHDGRRQDLFLENGRLGEVEELGLYPEIVERVSNKLEAIEAARSVFPSCDFDQSACEIGLKRLKQYRKEWDSSRGVWKDKPLHNDDSNAADGFMTFATGYTAPSPFSEDDDDGYNNDNDWGRNGTTGY